MDRSNVIERYTAGERRNHWIVALCFILAAMSGLALFHPALFWFTNFFGGGPWARILHPFIGAVMFVFFLITMVKFWNHNKLNANDRQWLSQMGDVINNREDKLPEVGRYNAGQKLLFWVMVLCMWVLIVTGIIFWRPYFAPAFSIGVIRAATLLHALAAFVLIAGIIVHIYAAIWVRGTIRAMSRGYVSHAWARKHHPAWYREVANK
jgi:formate dehydrogenase subunit gamma